MQWVHTRASCGNIRCGHHDSDCDVVWVGGVASAAARVCRILLSSLVHFLFSFESMVRCCLMLKPSRRSSGSRVVHV